MPREALAIEVVLVLVANIGFPIRLKS